jgi:hypothetical protein
VRPRGTTPIAQTLRRTTPNVSDSARPRACPVARSLGALAVALAGALGCSESPRRELASLSTRGLATSFAACSPEGFCCDPSCTYADTADATLAVPAALSTATGALTLASRGGDAGATTCGARVETEDAPLAVFYAVARDLPMRSATTACTRTERRCSGSGPRRSCADTCVAWKTRWDEVRGGVADFVTDPVAAGGSLGALGLSPAWDTPPGTSCGETCFLSWCATECAATSASTLACDPARYAPATGYGPFTTFASTFLAPLGTSSAAPVEGNPVNLALASAIASAQDFQGRSPLATTAVNLVVDDYPSGCDAKLPKTVALANAAATGWPRVETNVLQLGNLNAYGSIAQYGFGDTTSIDPAVNVRANTTSALASFRTSSDKFQYLIVPPASGEAVDPATVRFFLDVGGTDVEIPAVTGRDACGPRDGFWLDFPEGPLGRVRVNLCPKSERFAQAQRARGAVTYRCVGAYASQATYVRAADFDLTACNAAAMKARPLRFDWSSALPWNTHVRFLLQFAPRREDLATAEVFEYVAASWLGNGVGFADLAAAALPPNVAWARLAVTLASSTDPGRTATPRVDGWSLAFTCTDAM